MPEWLSTSIYVLAGILALVSIAAMFILMRRYENPFRLKSASWKQKWLWSATIPLFGFVFPLSLFIFADALIHDSSKLFTLTFYAEVIYISLLLFIPFTVVYWIRLRILQWQNNRYDRMLKDPKNQRIFQHGYFRMLRRIFGPFGGKDAQKFLEYGFSDEPQANKNNT